jgi:DNA-binding protein YbaB
MSVFGQVKGALDAQKKAKEIDKKLSGIVATGEHDLVKVEINYKGEIKEFHIDRDKFNPDDLDALEKSVVRAYENAQKNIQKIMIDAAKKDPSLLEMFGG